jgi:Fe-Mn family superoxide dismutase
MHRAVSTLGFVAAFACALATGRAAAAEPTGFTLDPLPYPADALAPVIDARTMEIHHGRHHRAYVDNLNAQIAKIPALQGVGLFEILQNVSRWPAAIRNNGGGHYNHTMFWASMAPQGERGEPSAELLARIEADFGSLDAMRKAFDQAGLSRFGSGWVWLVFGMDGKLKITTTANQDNPLMDVVPVEERGIPLLGNDVWEHAYYLEYQNRRADYLSAWWDVVDWDVVNQRYAAAALD